MTCLVNCTCHITHLFNVVSLTYISTSSSSPKSIWFEKIFLLNIWYNTWKFNSWYIILRDEWFEHVKTMSFFVMSLTLTFFNTGAEQEKQFHWRTHYFKQVCFISKQLKNHSAPLSITNHPKVVQLLSLMFEAIFLLLFYFLDIIISFASKSASIVCSGLCNLLVLQAQFHTVHHLLNKPGYLHYLTTKT